MAFFPQKLIRFFTGGTLRQAERGEQHAGPGYSTPEAGVVLSEERAMQLSTVFACTRIIAETVACLPLRFYRVDERAGTKTPLFMDDHGIVNLFNKPNRQMNGLNFRETLTYQLALWGNGYGQVTWSGNGPNTRPVNIKPLPPGQIVPFRQPDGEITYLWYQEHSTLALSAREVFHMKLFGTEGIVGLSPLGYARQSMGLAVAQEKYAGGVFANGGRPIGVLEFSQFLNEDQREMARKIHQDITAGPENSTNAWVLEGGARYQELTMSPDDMQMLSSRSFQVKDIARFFGVPSHMINDTEKSTTWGSGIEAMSRGFLQFTINSYLKRWTSTITDHLLVGRDKRTILPEHDTEAFLRGDSQAFGEYLAKMAQNGFITRNEGRIKMGMQPIDQDLANDLTIQVNLTDDLDEVGNNATLPQPAE